MKLFYSEDIRTTQRVTWVITACVKYNPHSLDPHFKKMIASLNEDNHDAIKRNITRTFQYIDIPEKYLAQVFDTCFALVQSHNSATAIKAFSMEVLYKICIKEPELSGEVIDLIQLQLPHGTSGVKARGRKIIAALQLIQ